MQMVVMLAGIVEHGRVLAVRGLDDLLERLALEFRALDRVVAVGDVSQMMLVMVIFERLLRHEGLERIVGVGQIGKGKGHRPLLGLSCRWKQE